jgi:hypothetical protein
MRPFLGNIGTTPARDLPDSHNCADFGQYLVGAPHRYALTTEELHAAKTDDHMDTNSVREGCILICPVEVPGAGVYMGDMQAQQGNGEIAGHATDVSGETELTVEVIKGLTIDGPILLQNVDDLPPMARPMNAAQRQKVAELGVRWGQHEVEQSGPITFIGSGVNLNVATENGLRRCRYRAKLRRSTQSRDHHRFHRNQPLARHGARHHSVSACHSRPHGDRSSGAGKVPTVVMDALPRRRFTGSTSQPFEVVCIAGLSVSRAPSVQSRRNSIHVLIFASRY